MKPLSFPALVSPACNWGIPVCLSMSKRLPIFTDPLNSTVQGVPLGSRPQCHMPVDEEGVLIANKLIKNKEKAFPHRHNNLLLSKQELSSRIALTGSVYSFALLNSLFCKWAMALRPIAGFNISQPSVYLNLELDS